jgi:hypothetical protein
LFLKRSALIDAAFEQAKQRYGSKPDGNQRPGSFLVHVIHFVGPFVSRAGTLLLLYLNNLIPVPAALLTVGCVITILSEPKL